MEIPAGEFKAKCLKLMDEVARTRRPVVITKRGKAVAQLVPPPLPEQRGALFGYMAGTGSVVADIVDVPTEPWAAEAGGEDSLYSRASKHGTRSRR
jgi:prevent-host-death family protein